jgi:hypothetical protein
MFIFFNPLSHTAMKTSISVLSLSIALISSLPLMAHAQTGAAFIDDGKLSLDARARYEMVNQDNPLEDADALTVRIRPAFTTGVVNGFSGMIEAELTGAIVDDYNSTRNGETKYSTIVDPESAEINQLFVKYVYSPMFDTTVGRQRINLDNQRYVGGVAWRDNEQTFDAISLNVKPSKELGFYYAYIDQVNTIFGSKDPSPKFIQGQASEQDSAIHLMQAKYAYSPLFNAVAYGYLMDFKDLAAWSNSTYGLRVTGKQDAFSYTAEFAKQSDYADQKLSYDANYYMVEGSVTLPASLPKGSIALGYEVLGSDDGKIGFQTPLATKHKFNGWTDTFLATPANGLTDFYLTANIAVLEKGKLGFEAHTFDSDEKSIDYGNEFGLSFAHPLPVKGLTALAKYSTYQAKDFGVDTDKLWLQVDYKY